MEGTDPLAAVAAAAAGGGAGGGVGTTTGAAGRVPIEHLDYSYVRKCESEKELTAILLVLRSGKEGLYPDLERVTEERLRGINPKAKVLQKAPAHAPSTRQLPQPERTSILDDLDAWAASIGESDRALASTGRSCGGKTLPPVRGSAKLVAPTPTGEASKAATATAAPAPGPTATRIPGYDFRAWDKYDVDKALDDLDADSAAGPGPGGASADRARINSSKGPADPATRVDTTPAVLPPSVVEDAPRDPAVRDRLAEREKAKGNECFKAGDFAEAVVYYTRSLSLQAGVAALNNRALCHLKLKAFAASAADCTGVLELDPGNAKALTRRANALKGLHRVGDALADVGQLLALQPASKEALKLQADLQALQRGGGGGGGGPAVSGATRTQASQPGATRLQIEEVDDDAADEGEGVEEVVEEVVEEGPSTAAAHEAGAGRSATAEPRRRLIIEEDSDDDSDSDNDGAAGAAEAQPPAPVVEVVPPRVAQLKGEGKTAFLAGQYSEALAKYTAAHQELQDSGLAAGGETHLALLNNLGACLLKTGDCRGCVARCDEALALDPRSIKAGMRRALALEALEKFAAARDGFRAVLALSPHFAGASAGAERCARALRALGPGHGPGTEEDPTAAEYEAVKAEGNALVRARRYAEAISRYTRCIALDGSKAAALNNRALCYLSLGQHEEAAMDAARVVAADPSNEKALFRRAKALLGLGRAGPARTDLEALLAAHPANAAAKKLLATLARAPAVERRRVAIEEVEDSESDESEGEDEGEDEAALLARKAAELEAERAQVRARVEALQAEQADQAHRVAEQQAELAHREAALSGASERVAATLRQYAAGEPEGPGEVSGADADAVDASGKPDAASETPAVGHGGEVPPSTSTAGRLQPATSFTATTSVAFVREVRQLGRNGRGLAEFLRGVDPGRVARLLSNQLEPESLVAVVGAAGRHLALPSALAHLEALTRADRFEINAMFLDAADRAAVAAALDALAEAATGDELGGARVVKLRGLLLP